MSSRDGRDGADGLVSKAAPRSEPEQNRPITDSEVVVTHAFHANRLSKYPDLLLRFQLRELVVRATEYELDLDHAIAALQAEIDFYNHQMKVTAVSDMAKKSELAQ